MAFLTCALDGGASFQTTTIDRLLPIHRRRFFELPREIDMFLIPDFSTTSLNPRLANPGGTTQSFIVIVTT